MAPCNALVLDALSANRVRDRHPEVLASSASLEGCQPVASIKYAGHSVRICPRIELSRPQPAVDSAR